ncbi:hypothetical protein TUM17576_45160 [Enterobacter hormaechei]|jgi:hypothetical protein|uniref:hypothetical protein n=1 Tax=Phytobacter diazotrophicus TaxID=395631 RepID=UPI000D16F80C|nr:hypothetical protein [Enterobacter hormaechei]MDU7134786.1 hypothetical protein [Enterobacteriaceae bacterium]PTA87958.1 hypothetical protein C9415_25705 [Kluyvera sp. Nf5]GJL37696.1 hypothetical protein TUM17576_45160 [Enterobacter hormaechei]
MGLIELFAELQEDSYQSVWLYRVFQPDTEVLLFELILSPSGEELARKPYYPDQPDRGWERTYWPHAPAFRTLPEGAFEMVVVEERTRLFLGISTF